MLAEKEQIQSYITERIDQYYNWYDSKAVKSKAMYQYGRLVQAVSAVLIPVVVNIKIQFTIIGFCIDSTVLVSIFGVIVALSIALEGVYHYREQWLNSRSTAEYLNTQKILFRHCAEDYNGLNDKQAFEQLVKRVESAIANENSVTLNVLTRSEQSNNAL